MTARFQMCAKKGFDAVEPDNIDGYSNSTGFSLSSSDQIAYNKWIKEQIVKWLKMPDLYRKLPSILSLSNIESNEIIEKADMLRRLVDSLSSE